MEPEGSLPCSQGPASIPTLCVTFHRKPDFPARSC